MAKLVLKFKGLLGFVPRKVNGQSGISVLMPTVSNPRHAASSPGQILSRHYPFFRIDTKYIIPNSPRIGDLIVKRQAVESAVIFAASEEFFLNLTEGSPQFAEFKEPTAEPLDRPSLDVSVELNNKQARDTKWVLDMSRAYPGAGAVDIDCLEKNTRALVSARFTTFEGIMYVSKLARQKTTAEGRIDAPLYLLPRVKAVPQHLQAISEEVCLEVDFTGSVVLLSSKGLATGTPKPPVLLQPINDFLELELHNSELEEIVGPALGTIANQFIGQPVDFEFLYELSSVRVPLTDRRTPSLPEGGTAGDRICPGGKFLLPTPEVAMTAFEKKEEKQVEEVMEKGTVPEILEEVSGMEEI